MSRACACRPRPGSRRPRPECVRPSVTCGLPHASEASARASRCGGADAAGGARSVRERGGGPWCAARGAAGRGRDRPRSGKRERRWDRVTSGRWAPPSRPREPCSDRPGHAWRLSGQEGPELDGLGGGGAARTPSPDSVSVFPVVGASEVKSLARRGAPRWDPRRGSLRTRR